MRGEKWMRRQMEEFFFSGGNTWFNEIKVRLDKNFQFQFTNSELSTLSGSLFIQLEKRANQFAAHYCIELPIIWPLCVRL